MEACQKLQKNGDLAKLHATNLTECQDTMANLVHTVVTLAFVFTAVLAIHFVYVVYSYWQ